ncbi:MAG TPA: Rne/Rng family ribonuclease [Mariprofundaceae bacterium]|nr:Rne/Rng family ribonuclease [Mariprofundaceae bacterium]
MKKKVMLINATHPEESRVAIVDDHHLQELDIESSHKVQTKSNIYKGTITKVEPSLQAAFVEYGAGRQGFLPLGEIHVDFWKEGADKEADPRKVSIQDVIERKQPVLVQVVKEERGNKGAALTTYISLAGRYLVLSPNTVRGGISRKLKDEDRKAMKQLLAQLNVPENMGLIVRTAGKDQTLEALQRDFSYLHRLWDEIRIMSESAPSPSLIYLEGDLATRAIRDHFSDDIDEIWVDKHDVYQRTKQFVHAVLPGKEKLVKLYRGKKPIFREYGVEPQCEEIHEREIRLPSGGSIVFDPTEALTSIDVNSSRSTGKKHIDDTALDTNMEAAREIARQLRIRDIGGLVVIDFIDMSTRKHAQQVEEELRKSCKSDKARVQFARISRFGLLEMSRQRLRPSIRESTTQVCPRCHGRGRVRTVESMALKMLTRMEDYAAAGKKPVLVVQVPTETGEYLMNNKREYVARTEEIYDVQINLQFRPDLEIPHYRIERQWYEEGQQRVEVLEDTVKGKKPPRQGRKLKASTPVVGVPSMEDSEKLEERSDKKTRKGLISLLTERLFGKRAEEKKAAEEKKSESAGEKRGRQQQSRSRPASGGAGAESGAENDSGRPRRRRSRGGRRRRGGGGQKGQQQGQQSQQEQGNRQASQDGQKQAGEAKKERTQPQKQASGKGPEAASGADDPATASGNGEGNGGATRRRRRRRRRPSAAKQREQGAPNTAKGDDKGGDNKSSDASPTGEGGSE